MFIEKFKLKQNPDLENMSPGWRDFNLLFAAITASVSAYIYYKNEIEIIYLYFLVVAVASSAAFIAYFILRGCPHCGEPQELNAKTIKINLFGGNKLTALPNQCPNCKLLYRKGGRRMFLIGGNKLGKQRSRSRDPARFFRFMGAIGYVGFAIFTFLGVISALVQFGNNFGLNRSAVLLVSVILAYLCVHVAFFWAGSDDKVKNFQRHLLCWAVPLLFFYFSYYDYQTGRPSTAEDTLAIAAFLFGNYCLHNIRSDNPDKVRTPFSHTAGKTWT